jgi:hypothetical protein
MSFWTALACAGPLTISDAYIPEGPPVSRVLAGFMKIHNSSADTYYISAIKSEDFGAIEMHLSKEVDGVARMFPQAQLVIEPNSTLILQPGSYHLMLFRPQRALMDGDRSVLTFVLGNGHSFDHIVTVRKMD